LAEAEAAVDAVRQEDPDEEGEEIDLALIEDEPQDALVQELEARIAEMGEESAALRDKWLRAAAELENYKKRVKKDMEDAEQRSTMRLLRDFLPTVDNLERALESVGTSGEQLGDGIRLVQREFLAALAKNDIEPVNAVGAVFDPNFHEALQQVDSPDHAPGVVMIEFERGYVRKGRLLRPSRVVVASAKSTGAPAPVADGAPDNGDEA
ncbi:MAG: nucleotide exchange factor GrpE, partial [Nannocystaceae bacterium]